MADFSAKQGSCWPLKDWWFWTKVPLVLLFVEQKGVSCRTLPSLSCQTLLVKKPYQRAVWRQHVHPADLSFSKIQHRPGQTLDTLFCPKTQQLWDNNELQAARGKSWEPFVLSKTRSFTLKETESGPKSRHHSIPSLEIEEVMLLYCRLNVNKMKLEMDFRLTVSFNTK